MSTAPNQSQNPDESQFPGESEADPVEEVLVACLEGTEEEQTAALEAACAEHPDMADALRERYRALVQMGLATGSSGSFPERLGDFHLRKRLGGGGMGVVFLAHQESLGREVALKLIRPEHLYFPGARARFRRETEAVAKLQHPNIVPIYTVGEEDGVPYFAMEHLEGCSLARAVSALKGKVPDLLSGNDLLQVVEAARVASGEAEPSPTPELRNLDWVRTCTSLVLQIARALEHAHGRGILHRDVKPSNVVLRPDGRAMLLDFGLTSSAGSDRVTRTGSQVGTLYYMSPEQIEGRADVDERSDVYSLGVTLYELLTLKIPFHGDSPLHTQRLILDGRVPSPRAHNHRISTDLETVVMTAMSREAEDRYPDCSAFARDLENVLALRPIEARPTGPMVRGLRWVQRNPLLGLLGAAAFLLVVCVPTGFWYQAKQHGDALEDQLGETQRAQKEAEDAQEETQAALDRAREERAKAVDARAESEKARELAQSEAETAQASLDFMERIFRVDLEGVDGEVDPRVSTLLKRGGEMLLEGREENPLVAARMMLSIGNQLVLVGDRQAAIEVLSEGLRRYDALDEPYDVALRIQSETNLGESYKSLLRFEEAREHLQASRALARTQDSIGEFSYLHATHVLATVEFDVMDFEASRRWTEEVLEAAPEEREDLLRIRAMASNLLGQIEWQEGRAEEALQRYLESDALTIRALGPTSIDRVHILRCIGAAHADLGQFDAAFEAFDEMERVLGEVLGPGSEYAAFARSKHGRALRLAQRNEEALEVLARAREDFVLSTGAVSRGVAEVDNQVALVLDAMGRFPEALEVFADALEMSRAVLPPGDFTIWNLQVSMGYCYQKNGDLQEALDCLLWGVEHGPSRPGAEDTYLTAWLWSIALQQELGHTEDSLASLDAVIEYVREEIDPDSQLGEQVLGWIPERSKNYPCADQAAAAQRLLEEREQARAKGSSGG